MSPRPKCAVCGRPLNTDEAEAGLDICWRCWDDEKKWSQAT